MPQPARKALHVGDRMRFSVKLIEQLRVRENDPLEHDELDVTVADITCHDGVYLVHLRRTHAAAS